MDRIGKGGETAMAAANLIRIGCCEQCTGWYVGEKKNGWVFWVSTEKEKVQRRKKRKQKEEEEEERRVSSGGEEEEGDKGVTGELGVCC